MSEFAERSREWYLEIWRLLVLTRETEGRVRKEVRDAKRENRKSLLPSVALTSFGEEAIGAGFSMALDLGRDWIAPGHRTPAALFRFGLTPEEYLSNHFAKATSPMGGRDGNVHFGFTDRHILKFISHMGASTAPACGIVDGLRYIERTLEKKDGSLSVIVASLGDGAAQQGVVHEAMNYASARHLPMIFVIDNNRTAIATPYGAQAGVPNLARRAPGYNMEWRIVPGNDVLAVYFASKELIERARRNEGPSLLECETYRMSGHNETEPVTYMDYEVYNEWIGRDPIAFYRHQLLELRPRDVVSRKTDTWQISAMEERIFSSEELDSIAEQVRSEVDEAFRKAASAPDPDSSAESVGKPLVSTEVVIYDRPAELTVEPLNASLGDQVQTGSGKEWAGSGESASGENMSFGAAIHQGLKEEMARNPKVRIFGEDVSGRDGKKGGVFGITRGLAKEFGADRVYDTPLSETAIIGSAIGQALVGLRPVAEMQFMPFASVADMVIRDYLAAHRYSTHIPVPLVIRMPYGGGFSGGHFHSACRQALYYHEPGLKLVCPSTPHDAKGLMIAALRDNDPIIFLEQIWAYSRIVGRVPAGEYVVPFGKAAVRQLGTDITLMTYGPLMFFHTVLPAAEALAKEGVSVEIVDIRSLKPLDLGTLAASAEKTGRVVIVDESCETGSIAESIAAKVSRAAFFLLKAPVTTVAALDTPVPQHPNLEWARLPDPDKVLAEARKLLAY